MQMTANSSGAGTVLLGIVAIALAGMAGTIGLINQVGELGPKVGDIVSFDPLDPMSRDMNARLAAMPADERPGMACVLDVRTMHANGGSVIIEAREPRHQLRLPRALGRDRTAAMMAPIAAHPPICWSTWRISRSWRWRPAATAPASKHVALLRRSARRRTVTIARRRRRRD